MYVIIVLTAIVIIININADILTQFQALLKWLFVCIGRLVVL